ncbi:stage III sporulation protein AA [Alkalihalobacillus sp. LMS39]|uniref:stage III sporulation protein AA n=1 Tax=Alkalihalobacillus sp. LMS39 TaxID=2924032 RepID=UPI001FB470E5|nr:stage III sporulation protein AA [Alkalihalobacillus sp. LMS39]UOE95914.1 stage III sporulation protein AA [Alkalihalobacillus sp. LMS39]
MEEVYVVLPESLRSVIRQFPFSLHEQIEEIRVRIHRPLEIIAAGKPYYPERNGTSYIVTREDAKHLLNQLSQYSLYAFEEELKQGYITIRGGHRVGLAGKVIVENGQVKALKEISSYNIRIAKQKIGVAQRLIPHIYDGGWLNTLLIGPPQTGKTTMLRDIARLISYGSKKANIPPSKVGIVDERSEIAACVHGIPQHDLGSRVDVLDGCPKADGMMMLIRSMSPDVLIVDEIGRKEDAVAIHEAVNAGVQLITTIHGFDMEDIEHRPIVKELLEMKVFDRCIELAKGERAGTIKRIRNSGKKDVVKVI